VDHILKLFSAAMAYLIVVGSVFQALPTYAADMRPVLADDDDEEDDKSVTNTSSLVAPSLVAPSLVAPSLVAPSGTGGLKDLLFEPLAAKNWSVEIGLRQRWSSRQGKRRAVEGATGLTFDVIWRDTLFASSDRGVGVNLFQTRNLLSKRDRFIAGVAFNIDDQSESERSRSQSRSVDVKRGVSKFALGFAEYQSDRWRLWTEFAHFVGNDKGNVVSLGVEYRLPLTNKWSATFASGLSFADKAYMRDNYSVPANYTLSKRPVFAQPKAGARDITVSADFEYQADVHWRWNTVIGFTNSLAVTQQGTWVKVRSEPFISTGIKYKF
jgi:outer membrane scaffolding protein for murein synthesis (MipA/OmpV family)